MFNEQKEDFDLEMLLSMKIETESKMLEQLEENVKNGSLSRKIDEELNKI